ncbi:MAG: NADP-dependent phosphogluconate dehydrogenase, partial [Pyrinomonadaceae bacterium]|nr:NADP-dependent phosphogluconate dehydrogenase [Pyrinomonadaceae bacterium]
GVMGRNFLLNVADSGFKCVGYDLDGEKVDALNKEGMNFEVTGVKTLEEFLESLETPRSIMLLVPAGKIVDAVINDLTPHLDQGDLIIDGGNSHFLDTERREKELNEKGFEFLGVGVSGGAEGARRGPSIMIGGKEETYAQVKPILEAVSAKVGGDPCAAHVGNGSAGHFVKMVHNGIEYGLMQLICETYDVMKRGLKMSNEEMSDTFRKWDEAELNSFLVEITAKILSKKDDKSEGYLVERILDTAGQKGTGRWTSEAALELGIPIPTIDAAVTMRQISALKEDRIALSKVGSGDGANETNDLSKEVIQENFGTAHLGSILLGAYIVTYAQGFSLLREASMEKEYDLNMAEIAKIWRGGCIIRAALLENFRAIFSEDNSLKNLLLDEEMTNVVNLSSNNYQVFVSMATLLHIPVFAFASAFSYFDAFRSERLPANLLQGQRDFFGSHTYKRIDMDGTFHTEWEELDAEEKAHG